MFQDRMLDAQDVVITKTQIKGKAHSIGKAGYKKYHISHDNCTDHDEITDLNLHPISQNPPYFKCTTNNLNSLL